MTTSERSEWIVGICSVVFDLDVGQQLECVFPNDALPEPIASAVAFHAFPVSVYSLLLAAGCLRTGSWCFTELEAIPFSNSLCTA